MFNCHKRCSGRQSHSACQFVKKDERGTTKKKFDFAGIVSRNPKICRDGLDRAGSLASGTPRVFNIVRSRVLESRESQEDLGTGRRSAVCRAWDQGFRSRKKFRVTHLNAKRKGTLNIPEFVSLWN